MQMPAYFTINRPGNRLGQPTDAFLYSWNKGSEMICGVQMMIYGSEQLKFDLRAFLFLVNKFFW